MNIAEQKRFVREFARIVIDRKKNRLAKLKRLRAAGMEPWPRAAERTHSSAEAIAAFDSAPEGLRVEATLVGRLRAVRTMGKTTFAHIEDSHGKIQMYLRADEVGAEQLKLFNTEFDLGDFVQASGWMFRTKTGETTLHVTRFKMLAKAISPPKCKRFVRICETFEKTENL